MRTRALLLASSVLFGAIGFVACSSSESSPSDPGDGGSTTPPRNDGSTTPPDEDSATPGTDAGSDVETPLTKQSEKEPNNGMSASDVNAMTLPGEMSGVIDVDDQDVFSLTLAPGDLWEWTATPTTADLAPHLVVFDIAPNSLNPTRLTQSAAGMPATLSHFVLRPGTFVAALRDARNVPDKTGKGGATYGYKLSGVKKAPPATPITFPATKTGKLGSLSALDFYSFQGNMGQGFDIVLKAKRKQPASTLDSRISLFNMTSKTTLITNDDIAGSDDSEVGGVFPANALYLLVVENEGTVGTDLSYELSFTLR